MKQSKTDLLKHLDDQLGFLQASASNFDSGMTAEAKRLAVHIRTLVHETAASKSLLGQLGWRNSMRFLSTNNEDRPGNLMAFHGLVGLRIGGGEVSYHAPMEQGTARPNRHLKFADWWNECVVNDRKTNRFSRRELVLALANKDGGAHVDPSLDEHYAELTRNNSVGWMAHDRHGLRALMGIELHSVRQIAYEVVCSVKRSLNSSK